MTAAAQQLPDSTDPATVAACLDWLHESLPWPHAPRGLFNTASSGFAQPRGAASARSWRPCEQCGGTGETRLGTCSNCEGAGGWHFDPMDERRAPLKTDAAMRPARDAPAVKFGRLSSATTAERLEEDGAEPLPPTLAQLVAALAELRDADRAERAMLQRVHVLRLDPLPALRPHERETYAAALEHLAELLPRGFRAPRKIRERAARRYRS